MIPAGTSLAMFGWTVGPEEPAAELEAVGLGELPQAATIRVAVSANPIVVRRRDRLSVRPISRTPQYNIFPGRPTREAPWGRILRKQGAVAHCGLAGGQCPLRRHQRLTERE